MKITFKKKAAPKRKAAPKVRGGGAALRGLLSSVKQEEIVLPILRQYLAECDARASTDKAEHRALVIEDAKQTVACFTERSEAYDEDLSEYDGHDMFHPSALGHCMRQMFFHELKAPDNGPTLPNELLRRHLTFELGTYFHVLFQNLLERAGILEKREAQILDKKRRTIGHADGILNIKGRRILLEIKTISPDGFAALKEPKEEHKMQTHDYMDCLGLDEVIFLYFDKGRHGVKEYLLKFDPAYHLQNVKKRKDEIFGSVKARRMPRREGKNPSGFPCMYCEFSKLCFDSGFLQTWMTKNKVKGDAL